MFPLGLQYNINQHNCLTLIRFFLSTIRISERFLKDCVIPKTGVMDAENSALLSQE